jgi:hypothetical protein
MSIQVLGLLTYSALPYIIFNILFHCFPSKIPFQSLICCCNTRMSSNCARVAKCNDFSLESRIVAYPDFAIKPNESFVQRVALFIRAMDGQLLK